MSPDVDVLRQTVSRDRIADIGRVSRGVTNQVLDRGLAVPIRALGSWLTLSNAVRGYLAVGYGPERWLTTPKDGVVLAEEIRDRGAGAASLVLERLVDELPPLSDPADLYRQPVPVPNRWDLREEHGLLTEQPPLVWRLLLRHHWVSVEATAAAIDAPLDRVVELSGGAHEPSELERARLQVLADVVVEYSARGSLEDADRWLQQPVSNWGSLAAHLAPWDAESVELLQRHLPLRP